MQQAKLKSLKKALIYSYQAATAILEDNREFRCLINPDKLTNDLDNKIISIPFKDICLNADRVGATTEGEQEIGLKVGDVFEWKETKTKWIVLLQRLEEDAYFRADIRKCKEVEANGRKLWGWLSGPTEKTLNWKKSNDIYFNDLNYTATLYVGKTQENLDFFKRFSVIKINGDPYEVQATDAITVDGIIEVYLKEDFKHTIQEEAEKETLENQTPASPLHGPTLVYPYDSLTYMVDIPGGQWKVSDPKRVKLQSKSLQSITISVVGAEAGQFIIYYLVNGQQYELPVVIQAI